jgi:hypothetical protein
MLFSSNDWANRAVNSGETAGWEGKSVMVMVGRPGRGKRVQFMPESTRHEKKFERYLDYEQCSLNLNR